MTHTLENIFLQDTANRFFDIEHDELDPSHTDFTVNQIAYIISLRLVPGFDVEDVRTGWTLHADTTGDLDYVRLGGYFNTFQEAATHARVYFADDFADDRAA